MEVGAWLQFYFIFIQYLFHPRNSYSESNTTTFAINEKILLYSLDSDTHILKSDSIFFETKAL